MPTNRRKRLSRRRLDVAELNRHQRRELESGACILPWLGFRGDAVAFNKAWRVHGREILEDFIERHPGRRPFAWWVEHGKERTVVASIGADLMSSLRQHYTCYG